jgi:hypothetical protein
MNNPTLTPTENEIGFACRKDISAGDEGEIDAIANPSGLAGLREKWTAEVDRVTRDLPSEDDYRSCLVTEGIPGSPNGQAESLDDFESYLGGLAPDFRVSATASQRDKSPEWQAYLAAEQEFLEADRACRSATVDKVLPQVVDARSGSPRNTRSRSSLFESIGPQCAAMPPRWGGAKTNRSAVRRTSC